MEVNTKMIVSIGLCTYKRPKMLARTLESLMQLQLSNNIKLALLIIDNDKNCSSKIVFEKYQKESLFDMHYIVEEKVGIVYARNRSLLAADKYNTDLMLFVDDDETVDKDWLNAHLKHYNDNDIDVSTAPVYSIYPEDTPRWIKAGEFFESSKDINEGTSFKSSATGNVLFNFKKLYDEYSLRFDEKLKSREDNDFFMGAELKGAKIQWTNTAIVHETVPLSRMNTLWLLQRVYKGGEAFAKREIKYKGAYKGRLNVLSRIPYYLIKGIVIFPLSLVKGYSYVVKSLRSFSTVVGMIGGMLGSNYDDYKSIHGD